MAAQSRWATAATAQWMTGWRRNRNEQWWRQLATAGVKMGDGNCGGMIVMGHNGSGAMDGGTVVQS
jgi:hypothetical protein